MTGKIWLGDVHTLTELQNRVQEAKQGISLADFIHQRKPLEIDQEGIAYVDVRGSLMDNCPNIYKLLGVTDYRDIASDISLAKELGAKGIILTVDSGGGEAMGTRECEKAISDCGLPVVAFGDSLMCSAAYKLSVCADYIVARESCQSGNIGVVLTYQDVSGMLNSIGVVQHTLTNEGASYKSIGHRADFADNEQEQFLQDSINRMGEDFWNHVVENRPNIDSECRKAGWYDGDTALELGVIDELGDLETAKERLLELIAITNVIVN